MNSKETLTCSLLHLPQDIFRVIFQYLSVDDLMKGDEAFLNNQELLSLYRSSLAGFTLKELITMINGDEGEDLISWIIDHKLLIETLELRDLSDIDMDLLNQSRFSLKTIYFSCIGFDSDNSVPISQLGHFPSLTFVRIYNSPDFTNDILLSFFSHNPQLEIVMIEHMSHLSNEIIPHFSNYCPKIKILSLLGNNWVNDGTISLLIQQRLFPNLKSLDIQDTEVTNEESLRQFILSHPLFSGLILPYDIEYFTDFLVFYLRQAIFPSILSNNNRNDLESHSLAILSLCNCLDDGIFDQRNDVVNPEIFSVDILSHLYHKDRPVDTLRNATQIFNNLSKFPSMIDSILQSQFLPFLLNSLSSGDYLPFNYLADLLFNCGIFHDYFPLLVEKYRTNPSSLIQIFHQAIINHFSLLTKEELQTMISIVLMLLQKNRVTYNCLEIISKLLQDPSSQHLFDPNHLLMSLKSVVASIYNPNSVIECLKRFISVDDNYQQLFIESNLLPYIMTVVNARQLLDFTKHCLLLSRDGLLVDHLVDSGLFQYLVSKFSQLSSYNKNEIESIFKRLIEFKNNKYSEMVMEMKLPNELRVKLF